MNRKAKAPSSAMTADYWNARYRIGTRVRFRDAWNDVETVTTSRAWTLGHGAAVVSVKGWAGGVGLSFLTLLTDPAADAEARRDG